VAVQTAKLEFWFSWLPPQQDGQQTQAGWKLHDIRLAELDTDLNWYESISEATMRFSGSNRNSVRNPCSKKRIELRLTISLKRKAAHKKRM
jgi:hypothetical protein